MKKVGEKNEENKEEKEWLNGQREKEKESRRTKKGERRKKEGKKKKGRKKKGKGNPASDITLLTSEGRFRSRRIQKST